MEREALEALLARIDVWLLVFGVIVVIGVAGESFFGIRHWWNSHKLQRIIASEDIAQRAKIARLSNDTARLEQENRELRKRVRQRILDHKPFLEALKGKPTATAEMLYKPEDDEAYSFAGQIKRWLGPGVSGDGAGWNVLDLQPIPMAGTISEELTSAPSATRHGAFWGLGIIANTALPMLPWEAKTPVEALVNALLASGFGAPVIVNTSLPADRIIIVVGQKM